MAVVAAAHAGRSARPVIGVVPCVIEASRRLPGLRVVEREGPMVTLAPQVDRSGEQPLTAQTAVALVVRTLAIDGIGIEEDDLEDVIRSAFQEAAVDDAAEAAGHG